MIEGFFVARGDSTIRAFYATERQWHPTQTEHHRPDGSVEIRFKACGGMELERFVQGWGGSAEVLEPEELRRTIRAAWSRIVKANAP